MFTISLWVVYYILIFKPFDNFWTNKKGQNNTDLINISTMI